MKQDRKISEYKTANEKRKHRRRMAYVITAALLTVAVVFFIVKFVFVVEEVSLLGAENYDSDELISAAGIKYGQSIFSVSESRVEKRLSEKYPYIKSVDIYREYPSVVVMTVNEEHTTFYTEFEGEYFLFNYAMRVMDRFDSEEGVKAVREGAVKIITDGIEKAVVGDIIEFSDEESSFVYDTVYALSSCSFVGKTVFVDLTDRYDIRMNYDNRISIVFGSFSEIEKKIENADEIMYDISEGAEGNIDVSDPKKGYVSVFEG